MEEVILMIPNCFHILYVKLQNLSCGNAGVNSYGIYNIVMRSKYDEEYKMEIFLCMYFHQMIL